MLDLLFFVLWMGVGFVGIRWLARPYFSQPRRSVAFAACVVLAFAAGAFWPFSNRVGGGASAGGPSSVVPVAPTTAPFIQADEAPAGRDVSARCRGITVTDGGARGNIDAVLLKRSGSLVAQPPEFTAGVSDDLILRGWAVATKPLGRALAACLVLDGKVRNDARALYGSLRPDVATALHDDAIAASGFQIAAPLRDVPPGKHRIAIAGVYSTGRATIVTSVFAVDIPL